jgi:hypothetical protein
MRKTNKIITIVLAVVAAVAWLPNAIYPFFGFANLQWYPEISVPYSVTISAAACFGWLLLFLSERRGDNETRCRKCNYILRGLSEPRCPECGERI